MSSNTMNSTEAPKKNNKRFIIVLALLVVLGSTFGLSKYYHAKHHEETEDAQVDASIYPVIPRVSGFIMAVLVSDNVKVKKGDTLVKLDDRDLKIKLAQAEAALAAAKSNLGMAQASTSASKSNILGAEASTNVVDAQIEVAKVNVRRSTQDFNRYANLIKDHSITQQQYEQAEAAKETAERQLQALQQQRSAALRQTSAISAQSSATAQQIGMADATIKQREADVENAKLNLSYTILLAPADGLVSRVNVQSGQFIQAGQAMFSVVPESDIWVVANFKETQLDRMKVGQKVTIAVDAFDDAELEGEVASFSPATGSRFSLLPPDNASGNFVKVVQRVPVKIRFSNKKDGLLKKLRPGMNVNVDVHID